MNEVVTPPQPLPPHLAARKSVAQSSLLRPASLIRRRVAACLLVVLTIKYTLIYTTGERRSISLPQGWLSPYSLWAAVKKDYREIFKYRQN
jgi:hypothetical protein